MILKKIHAICIILCLSFAAGANSAPGKHSYTWLRLNGTWEITDSKLIEKRVWISKWRYYALLDYNTVRTIKPLRNITEIRTGISLSRPYEKSDSTELLLSFAVRSPYKGWYFHLYGFKLTGDKEGIKNIHLIHSNRKDKKKRYATKNNYFEKIIASKKIKLDYNKKYTLSISLHRNTAAFFVNGKKILASKLPVRNFNGQIALSSRYISPQFDYVKVFNGKKLLLHDSFDKPETLRIPGVKVKIKTTKKKKK